MPERSVAVEVSEYGTILEEIELVCPTTGFKRGLLVEHTVGGLSYATEVF